MTDIETEFRRQVLACMILESMPMIDRSKVGWQGRLKRALPGGVPHVSLSYGRNAMRNQAVEVTVFGRYARISRIKTFIVRTPEECGIDTVNDALELLCMNKDIEVLRDYADREWGLTW